MAHYHQREKDARLEAKKHRPPCKRCGKPVPVEMDSRAVYCSHACQNKGGIDKTCAGCGRAFKGHKRGKFCSQACMGLAFRRQDRTCQHCGTAYTPTHGRQRYCGHSCAGKRSEEHTSELQSLMRISYAVFCLKKNNYTMSQLKTAHLTPLN